MHIGPDAYVLIGADAVRLPVAGGWVATAWGTELHRVVRTADELTPGADLRGTA